MPTCCVPFCRSRSGQRKTKRQRCFEKEKGRPLKLYRFPLKDQDKIQRWKTAIGRYEWQPTAHSRVCEIHFEKKCFQPDNGTGRIELVPYAVPTVFPEGTGPVPQAAQTIFPEPPIPLLKMSEPIEESSSKCFGGFQKIFKHESHELKCSMKFAIYLPPKSEDTRVPVIYWLSGLTCNEQNFIQKAGAQRLASQYGYIIVCPDTSPRNCNIRGEDDSWDFGSGAGFYVDATREPWSKHYRMYSYVTSELPKLIEEHFPVNFERQSIMGHSMGGHGALISALKNPGKYRSVSAFAPICNPSQCPWGRDKAFPGYLGGDAKTPQPQWDEYDATELVKKYNGPPLPILIDQGDEDSFLKNGQLLPHNFVNASKDSLVSVVYRQQGGYDHSYFFIASFIEGHFKHHSKYLDS